MPSGNGRTDERTTNFRDFLAYNYGKGIDDELAHLSRQTDLD